MLFAVRPSHHTPFRPRTSISTSCPPEGTAPRMTLRQRRTNDWFSAPVVLVIRSLFILSSLCVWLPELSRWYPRCTLVDFLGYSCLMLREIPCYFSVDYYSCFCLPFWISYFVRDNKYSYELKPFLYPTVLYYTLGSASSGHCIITTLFTMYAKCDYFFHWLKHS